MNAATPFGRTTATGQVDEICQCGVAPELITTADGYRWAFCPVCDNLPETTD